MIAFPTLSKKAVLACACLIASSIIAGSILYSEHVNAQASPPYDELGCGATSIPAGINCIGGEPVLVDCDATQMGYAQVNPTTKSCGGSTPQWSHTDNWGYCQTDSRCTTPVACTMTNSCGQFNTGTVQSDGSCSVSAPADPAGYGSSCTAANACGTSSSGAIQCNGSCSATAPALPSGYGTSCSVSNSCGASTNYGTIDCSGSCSASAPSEASCATSANLTATNTSPATGTAGSITLTGTVTNGGSATASPSFTQYFEVQGNSTLTWTSPGITVAAGSSANVSATRSFAAGSYQVRMCADGTGAVTESNENDNCSAWNALNVAPASGSAPTVSLTAAPTTITLGNSSTLTWSSTNATSCTGTGFSTGGAASNNAGVSVTPATTGVHTYQIQCTGPGGLSPVASANVTVNPASGGSCTGAGPIDITATPNRVQVGQGTTLSWTVADAASATCTVTNQNTGALVKTTAVSSCAASDSALIPSITAQTTYRLACGALTKDVIVNIVPRFEEF